MQCLNIYIIGASLSEPQSSESDSAPASICIYIYVYVCGTYVLPNLGTKFYFCVLCIT